MKMDMHGYLLRMTKVQFQALWELARRERRSIKGQIVHVLWTAGAIPDEHGVYRNTKID